MRRRWRKGKIGSSWERERNKFFDDRGIGIEEVGRRREEGEAWFREIVQSDIGIGKGERERWERISGSRYNRWYKMVKNEGIPDYLKKGGGEDGKV